MGDWQATLFQITQPISKVISLLRKELRKIVRDKMSSLGWLKIFQVSRQTALLTGFCWIYIF